MAKKFRIDNNILGALLITGLIIQYVLPHIPFLNMFRWLAPLLYLGVALYLLMH